MSGSIALFLIFSCSIFPFFASAGESSKLMKAEHLESQLNDPDLVLVDCRSNLSYRKGHIKAAINLDAGCSGPLVRKLGKVPCHLKKPDEIRVELAKKGICPNRSIVVYGDHNSWGAEGRLFWILEKLGFTRISLLNGGYDHWQKISGPTSAIFADHKEPCKTSDLQLLPVAGLQQFNPKATSLHSLYQKEKLIFLDVRTRAEYSGAILYREERGGHLPEALHFNWEDFWDSNYRLKSRSKLLLQLTEAGLPRPEQAEETLIIPYCTGGIRSGFAWFVLEWLGYPKVDNYDNGFWEWASRPELPVSK